MCCIVRYIYLGLFVVHMRMFISIILMYLVIWVFCSWVLYIITVCYPLYRDGVHNINVLMYYICLLCIISRYSGIMYLRYFIMYIISTCLCVHEFVCGSLYRCVFVLYALYRCVVRHALCIKSILVVYVCFLDGIVTLARVWPFESQ